VELNNDRHDCYSARGAELYRGNYISREFRNRQYVVNDYRQYHMSHPPREHESMPRT
jgi:Ni/Co efflux regulator RcnB